MSVQIIGNGGVVGEVESNTRAMRTTLRPLDVGSLGSYRLAAFSGLMTTIAAATATAGHVYAWRWGDATRLAILRYIKMRAAVITGFTAAQELSFDAIFARSYSGSHTAGTNLAVTTNNNKKRTSMGASLLTDARIATGAALTAGTHTLDGNPFAVGGPVKTLAAAATVQDGSLEMVVDLTNGVDYPIVFAQNEGFVIRNVVLMGAAGTVRMAVEVAWDEVSAY